MRILTSIWMFLSLCAGVGRGSEALAQSPEPPAMPTVDRLAAPTMPANPTQADYGAQVYYLVCMSCHGDRGQGLTDEWRGAWSPGDQDCWQSKCHAANHPPEGFELVRYVPPVVGEKALARILNAAELHEYISTQMPWQAPGSLPDDEYWQLTAFLLRANGRYSSSSPLGLDNVTGVPVTTPDTQATANLPPMTSPEMPPPRGRAIGSWLGVLVGVLIVAALVAIWVIWRGRSSTR